MTAADDRDHPRAMPWKVLLVAGVLIWASFGLVPELGDFLPRTRDQAAIIAVVERMIVANQSVGIPTDRDSDGHVSGETIEALRAQAREAAAQLFTVAYRDTWIARTYDVIALEVSSEFVFDGGAHDFTRWQIAIWGDEATVSVRCRIFLEMAQTVDVLRSRAENTVDYEVTLDRVDGAWLVASESNRFAPGGGP